MEVISGLFGTLVPIIFTSLAHAIVGSIAAWQTKDVAIATITALGVAIALVRGFLVCAYRHRVAKGPPLGRTEALRWKRRYAVGTGATAFVLGLFAARSLMLDNDMCAMMAFGISFGFGAGIVARLSLVPFVALADLSVMALPPIIVALTRFDAPHFGLAMLMAIYLVGSFEMVRLTFNTMVNQMALKRQFEQLARLDPMTGAFNRLALTSDLPQLVAARRDGMVAVFAIDLDHFKEANDRFGHPVGDALLKRVAGELAALAAPNGMVIRMGGDEFILVQPSLRSRDQAETLADRIVAAVATPHGVAGNDIVIGASIGIAMSPGDGTCADVLLARADKALYKAKASRGGYVLAQDLPVAAAVSEEPLMQPRAA